MNNTAIALSPSQSPTAKKKLEPAKVYNFYDALKIVMGGSRISKLEWNNTDEYGVLGDGHLRLHKPDGKQYNWILSDGDILGEDYIVV